MHIARSQVGQTPYEELEKDMMFISNNHNLWHVVITTTLTIGFDSKLSNKLQNPSSIIHVVCAHKIESIKGPKSSKSHKS